MVYGAAGAGMYMTFLPGISLNRGIHRRRRAAPSSSTACAASAWAPFSPARAITRPPAVATAITGRWPPMQEAVDFVQEAFTLLTSTATPSWWLWTADWPDDGATSGVLSSSDPPPRLATTGRATDHNINSLYMDPRSDCHNDHQGEIRLMEKNEVRRSETECEDADRHHRLYPARIALHTALKVPRAEGGLFVPFRVFPRRPCASLQGRPREGILMEMSSTGQMIDDVRLEGRKLIITCYAGGVMPTVEDGQEGLEGGAMAIVYEKSRA